MVKQMNNEILDKVDEIINFIKDTSLYKDYVLLKEKLDNNDKVKALVNSVKKTQQELVKAEAYGKDTKELEEEYNSLLLELDKIPLYKDYNEAVINLNLMYSNIKERLDNYFYDKLNQTFYRIWKHILFV